MRKQILNLIIGVITIVPVSMLSIVITIVSIVNNHGVDAESLMDLMEFGENLGERLTIH